MIESDLTKEQMAALSSYMDEQELDATERDRLTHYLIDEPGAKFYQEAFFVTPEGDVDQSLGVNAWFPPLELYDIFNSCRLAVIDNKEEPMYVLTTIHEIVGNRDGWGAPGDRYFWFRLVELLQSDPLFDSDANFRKATKYVEGQAIASHPALNWIESSKAHAIWGSPDFDITLHFLESLPDCKSKIQHLTELLIECEAYHAHPDPRFNVNEDDTDNLCEEDRIREDFIAKCRTYITKFERLDELKKKFARADVVTEGETLRPFDSDNPESSECEPSNQIKNRQGKIRDQHPDLTIDRAILFLQKIIPNFSELPDTKQAEVISFLTSFDFESIRQRVGKIDSKQDDGSPAYKKDSASVKKYLRYMAIYGDLPR